MKTTHYHQAFRESIENADRFWMEQAERIHWFKKPTVARSIDENGFDRWFAGGQLNTCYLALDHHIENGRGNETALIYDSPVTQTVRKYSYNEMLDEVSSLAGGLRTLGVEKGDTVVIYMPMIPEATFAMLACARIGAVHSVVFGGFAPHELALRIDDAKPKAIITATSGIEVDRIIAYKPLVDEALEKASHQPKHVVVLNRRLGAVRPEADHDIDYKTLALVSAPVDPVPVDATDPLYILYTSGTTGKPKGIVRDNGGHAVALNYSMNAVYGVQPGEVFWAASDVGWVVGHSYIVYAPLIHGNTTVLFEGKPIKTPDASTFWRVISEHDVRVMFTAPTAIRAIRKEDPNGEWMKKFDLSGLRYQFLAGERCDSATLHWLEEKLGIPVIDHWWQTESGWPMLANMMGYKPHPVKAGSATMPVCGYNLQVLREDGSEANPNEEGYVVVERPLPPGTLPFLWNDKERFIKGYLSRFPGYYFSGDGGYIDDDGYVFITGRVDDIINVAGHRLSTAEMEEVVASNSEVAECTVIGINDELKGQVPLAIVVGKSESSFQPHEIVQSIVADVRREIGPVAALKKVCFVERLPKTRSGKILRKTLRAIADGMEYTVPSTIDDPSILDEIEEVFQREGIARPLAK